MTACKGTLSRRYDSSSSQYTADFSSFAGRPTTNAVACAWFSRACLGSGTADSIARLSCMLQDGHSTDLALALALPFYKTAVSSCRPTGLATDPHTPLSPPRKHVITPQGKADQLDAAVLAKLDEVGPMLPVLPRAPVRGDAAPTPPTIGRQGLRRARRSTTAAAAAGGGIGGGASSGVGGGAAGGDGDEDEDSGDDQPTMSRGGGGKGGGGGSSSSSFTNLPARTPPALLIPRRADSGPGGDSPVLPPPEKLPKLDDDALSEDVGAGAGAGLGVGAGAGAGAASSLSGAVHHEMYHSGPPEDVGLFEAGGALGSLDDHATAGAGGGQGTGDSSLLFQGLGSGFGQRGPGADDPVGGGDGSHAADFAVPAEGIRDVAGAAASPGSLRSPSAAAAGEVGLAPLGAGSGVAAAPGAAVAATGGGGGEAGVRGAAPLELSGLGGFSSSSGAGPASAPLPVDEARTSGETKPSPGSGLESALGSSADVVASSLLGGNGGEAEDPVASALEGIIGDEVDLIDDASATISDPYGGSSGGASAGAAAAATAAAAAAAAATTTTRDSGAPPAASNTFATGGNVLGVTSSAATVPPVAAHAAPPAPPAPPAPAPSSLTPPTAAAASAASTGGDTLGTAAPAVPPAAAPTAPPAVPPVVPPAVSTPALAPSPTHAAPSTDGGGGSSSTSDPPPLT